ncbi:MAG: winged helix-turn-helix transcriptional regulator [Burkholderiales bacterium]|jgi:DNA-binding MarR family transcriptional regulator|nr:winged helix-turn-helix transcriptional regulator [Burkholderiales bacterium]
MPVTRYSATTRARTAPRRAPAEAHANGAAAEPVDSSFLQSLLGYNASRVSLAVVTVFLERMAVYDLRPINFSVLSLIKDNPGITSRQICAALGMQPPNVVGMVGAFEKRGLIERQPHPHDGRAVGLHLTDAGSALMREAEPAAVSLEAEVAARLSDAERRTLMRLLQKIYL